MSFVQCCWNDEEKFHTAKWSKWSRWKRKRWWTFLGNFYLLSVQYYKHFLLIAILVADPEIKIMTFGLCWKETLSPFASFAAYVKGRYFGIHGVGQYRFKCTSLLHCVWELSMESFICVLSIPHILYLSPPILTHSTPQSTAFSSVSLSFKCISCEQIWKICQDALSKLWWKLLPVAVWRQLSTLGNGEQWVACSGPLARNTHVSQG